MNHVQIKLHPTMYKLYCCYIFPSEKYAGTKLFNYLLIFSKTKTQQSLYQNVGTNIPITLLKNERAKIFLT
jgi:hypothetical protein